MRVIVAGVIAATLAAPGFAATYYVKNSGSDAADGLSDANAWQTISKVNGASFSCNDVVLFNRGDRWRERLVPPSGCTTAGQTITFGSYGTGARPEITGFNSLGTWTAEGTPNVWQAAAGGTEPKIVVFQRTAGRHRTSIPNLAQVNDWYYASSTLYVYATEDPDNGGALAVEIGLRDGALSIGASRENLVFRDLHFLGSIGAAGASSDGIIETSGAQAAGASLTFERVEVSLGYDLTGYWPDDEHQRIVEGFHIADTSDWDPLRIVDSYIHEVGHGIQVGRGTKLEAYRNVIEDTEDDCFWLLNESGSTTPIHEVVANICARGGDEGVQADQSAIIRYNTIHRTSSTGIKIGSWNNDFWVTGNIVSLPGRVTNEQVAQLTAITSNREDIIEEFDYNLVYKTTSTRMSDGFEGCAVDSYWTSSTGSAVSGTARTGSCSYSTSNGLLSRTVATDPEGRVVPFDFAFRVDSSSTLGANNEIRLFRVTDDAGTPNVITLWLAVNGKGILFIGMSNDATPTYQTQLSTDTYYLVEFRRHPGDGTTGAIYRAYLDGARFATIEGVTPGTATLTTIELGEVAGDTGQFVVNLDDVVFHETSPDLWWTGFSGDGSKRSTSYWNTLGWDNNSVIGSAAGFRSDTVLDLLGSSPAIDVAIEPGDVDASLDVRQHVRPVGSGWEIGAYEFGVHTMRGTTQR